MISVQEAVKLGNPLFIDMRSPAEYATGHVPGAVNIPLFTDDERAVVGTIYKQIGVEEAKHNGLKIVSSKLPEIVGRIRDYYNVGKTVVVYCWRGGMRSKSVVTVLEIMGISAYQLMGGYKAYRRHVIDSLQNFHLEPQIVVLCGSTGVGKTSLLKILAHKGVPVIDLEQLANHRGSAFGQIGLGKPATAQNFDATLLLQLQHYNNKPYIMVECESKRIGNVYLPDILYQAMQCGKKILAYADIETRITRLIAEYTDICDTNYDSIVNSVRSLTKRVGKRKVEQLISDLSGGKMREAVSTLLTEYYDPLYGYENSDSARYDFVVNANNLDMAASSVMNYLERQLGGSCNANSRRNIAQ